MKPDPYIGIADIRRAIIKIAPSTFCYYALKKHMFGPVIRGPRNQVMVRESRVRAWVDGGCKPTTHQMVNDHA